MVLCKIITFTITKVKPERCLETKVISSLVNIEVLVQMNCIINLTLLLVLRLSISECFVLKLALKL